MTRTADPNYDPFPKYLQIREIVLRWLSNQEIGQRLPTEMDLAQQFKVSRQTIRKALRWLEHEQIITRRPRLGTFLEKLPTALHDQRLTGPIEEFGSLGVVTKVRLVRQGWTSPSDDVRSVLQASPGEEVYEVQRIRLLEGLPLLLLQAYFPLRVGEKVVRRGLNEGLIVPVLRKIHDAKLWEAYQQIDACSATRDISRHLGVPKGFPILLVTRVFVDSSGKPSVLFRDYFRSDRYYYTVKLPRNGIRY